jgi:hypothetical protein
MSPAPSCIENEKIIRENILYVRCYVQQSYVIAFAAKIHTEEVSFPHLS